METKIRLSEEESNLVTDASVLLTKNRVIGKMHSMLGDVCVETMRIFNAESVLLPESDPWPSPKISKGENYLGLPYLILDHPRLFGQADVFAVRTMFWWGHYFSVTLHLKGIYFRQFFPDLRREAMKLSEAGYVWNAGEDEWKHELQAPFYTPVSCNGNGAEWKERMDSGFLKLGVSIPLLPLGQAFDAMLDHHRLIAGLLGINYQGDGTGL